MIETVAVLIYGALLLLFGITLTAAFAGIQNTRKNTLILLGLYLLGGSLQLAVEFLPLFLIVMYMIFCFVYYQEYEQKADALRKEQIISIAMAQQSKQFEDLKRSEQEIRLLRHDMRMLLSSLAVCVENNDAETARELIASHIDHIDGTRLQRFCENDIVNYVLSDYAAKCNAANVDFILNVQLDTLKVEDVPFCSILSNALDNALNAQKQLPAGKRYIKLMLKNSDGKLLMSVKNPVGAKVVFADGLPVTGKRGHPEHPLYDPAAGRQLPVLGAG